jgi:hypothetical protein
VRVHVVTAGALTHSMPRGRDVIEGEALTVRTLLDGLVVKHGPPMAEELMDRGNLQEGLVLLVNGRNVLSLPARFETALEEGDEVLIAVMVAGG